MKRALRKNVVLGIIITVIVSFVILALGTYMNYLIAIRSENTENAIDLMYKHEGKSSKDIHYSSENHSKVTVSLVTSNISRGEGHGNYLQNEVLFAVCSFTLLILTSLINLIRSSCCTVEPELDSNKKHGVPLRTTVYVSVGTDTCNLEEVRPQSSLV